QFLGTHQNKLDAKGRVSIPAPFRAALKAEIAADDTISFVVRPSHIYPCIEAWPLSAFEKLEEPLDQLATFSEEQQDLATVIYPDALPLECDREGRVLLPESLVRHAGLSLAVTFLGLGRNFQIWEPAAADRRVAEAHERVRSRGLTLPAVARGSIRPAARPT
ncbi:MAG: division/cell wall cluster transcriptional repressor MraZ, partial [Acetobacteraceae bacterium]